MRTQCDRIARAYARTMLDPMLDPMRGRCSTPCSDDASTEIRKDLSTSNELLISDPEIRTPVGTSDKTNARARVDSD